MTDTAPVPPGGARPWLIVGLGNPGRDYERSRHNAGARAVASLADRLGTPLRRSKFRALVGEARTDGVPVNNENRPEGAGAGRAGVANGPSASSVRPDVS